MLARFTQPGGCDNLRALRLASATALWLTPLTFGACSSSDTGPSPVDTGFIDANDANDGDIGFPDVKPNDAGILPGDCDTPYPAFASPMALDQAVPPWSWPRALDGQGVETDLNLTDAFCNTDPDLDWSPFDLLLFVSIPGW